MLQNIDTITPGGKTKLRFETLDRAVKDAFALQIWNDHVLAYDVGLGNLVILQGLRLRINETVSGQRGI